MKHCLVVTLLLLAGAEGCAKHMSSPITRLIYKPIRNTQIHTSADERISDYADIDNYERRAISETLQKYYHVTLPRGRSLPYQMIHFDESVPYQRTEQIYFAYPPGSSNHIEVRFVKYRWGLQKIWTPLSIGNGTIFSTKALSSP